MSIPTTAEAIFANLTRGHAVTVTTAALVVMRVGLVDVAGGRLSGLNIETGEPCECVVSQVRNISTVLRRSVGTMRAADVVVGMDIRLMTIQGSAGAVIDKVVDGDDVDLELRMETGEVVTFHMDAHRSVERLEARL
ncbi:hypothetical protein [Pseudomonas sp. KCJK9000]|uniref:hypothetical protein n=1 Tax=Pseudomonas sp. KCJK9000 TaxID=3344566 RepID=UPI003906A7F6